MEDFTTFEIAKKLKEKGFTCKYPFAMYNELGSYCPLTTSSDSVTCESGYKYISCYDYNDFDENDFIAPTISQVLKWLRDKFFLHISQKPYPCEDGLMWMYEIRKFNKNIVFVIANKTGFVEEEQAAIAGIEYVLDNLI